MSTDTRTAWCTVCGGPREADDNGCLECRCADCGDLAQVMLAVVRNQQHMRLCIRCWRRS